MLQEKFKSTKIILASGSPRRQELLKGLDIPFEVNLRPVKEVYPKSLKRSEITDYLAILKASVFDDLKDDELLITSDTIVWFNDKPVMKPKDINEAKQILRLLSGHSHTVYTSVCLTSSSKQVVFSDDSKVFFDDFNDKEIDYYIAHYNPFDKAGGYGIQDWLGYIGITKIEGSYFNIMGLPLQKLYKELKYF